MERRIAPALMLSTLTVALCMLLTACGNDAPPRSVQDFEDDRAALDAKLLSCRADRRKAIDDIECQHARIAGNRIAMADEAERRAQLERNSQRQLDALRRQRAAAVEQEAVRDAALVQSAERKIAVGQSLTEAEAIAIGVDPENSVLVDGGAAARFSDDGARLPGAGGATPRDDVAPTGIAVSPPARYAGAANETTASGGENDAGAVAGEGADPRPSLAEIREALKAERDADASDEESDDE